MTGRGLFFIRIKCTHFRKSFDDIVDILRSSGVSLISPRHGWRMRHWLPIEHWWPIKAATRAVFLLESSVLVNCEVVRRNMGTIRFRMNFFFDALNPKRGDNGEPQISKHEDRPYGRATQGRVAFGRRAGTAIWVHTLSHSVVVISITESTWAMARSCIARDSHTAFTEGQWKNFLSLVSRAASLAGSDPMRHRISVVGR
jgi:hypothetical protein